MKVPEYAAPNGSEDGMPVPEPECPRCGHDRWRYVQIPGQVERRKRLVTLVDRMVAGCFGLAFVIAVLLALPVPGLHELALVAIGAFIVLVLVVRGLRRRAYEVATMVEICESCGFTKVE